MLAQAGVAVFLFGNKRNALGTIVPADGMEEEFEIATAKRLSVIPVGCTGSVAASLHQRVLDHFTDYFPASGYKRLFQALSTNGTPKQVAARVVTLLQKLRDDRAIQSS
jgi:hypothetical protein